jgi:endonuclease/exonuclease/phosphatase family metal-dependent hydrolase
MKIANWNILHGLKIPDGIYDQEIFCKDLTTFKDIDILCVQEVDLQQPRTNLDNQLSLISSTLNLPYSIFAPALSGTPGESFTEKIVPGPQFGVGIASRIPFTSTETIALKPAPFGAPLFIPKQGWIYIKDEPRVALAAHFSQFTLITTHLSFIPGFNIHQLRQIQNWARTFPNPTLLTGDLNLPPRILNRVTKWNSLISFQTYPSWGPKMQLDYLLSREDSWKINDIKRIKLQTSDHFAIQGEIEIPELA